MDNHPGLTHWQRQQCIIHYAALIVSIIVAITTNILQSSLVQEPYHTSALSGDWSFFVVALTKFALNLV